MEAPFHEQQHLFQCAVHALNSLLQERWVSHEQLDAIADELYEEEQLMLREAGVSTGSSGGGGGGGTRLWFNPYRSVLPYLGNYDVNVILRALSSRGYTVQIHWVSALWQEWEEERQLRELRQLRPKSGKLHSEDNDVDNDGVGDGAGEGGKEEKQRQQEEEGDEDDEIPYAFIVNVPRSVWYLPFSLRHWFALRKVGDLWFNLDSKLPEPQAIGSNDALVHYLHSLLTLDGEAVHVFAVQFSTDAEQAPELAAAAAATGTALAESQIIDNEDCALSTSTKT